MAVGPGCIRALLLRKLEDREVLRLEPQNSSPPERRPAHRSAASRTQL